MLRGILRALAISTAIAAVVFGGLFVWIQGFPGTYREFWHLVDVYLINEVVIGAALIVIGLFVLPIIVGGPVLIVEKIHIWWTRRKDGNLGRYDDPDYLEQRD